MNTIIFRGVRGSLARPSIDTLLYGGNTPCLEVRSGGELLIFDTGTGVFELGKELAKKGKPVKASILYTHYHWDHILGLPFFSPIYDKRSSFTIYGRKGLKKALSNLLSTPNFPVKLGDLKARVRFVEKKEGLFKIGKVNIVAFDVNHPNGAFGYRMEFPGGKNVVFISDNGPARDDSKLVDMAYGSDILIHDAQYLPKEFRDKRKFGHSPYNYALDIAFKARVRTLILFHHDPGRDDRGISRIENDAQQLAKKIGFRGAVFAAREGLELGC